LGLLGAVVAAGSILAILVSSIRAGALGTGAAPQLEGETPALGRLLFTEYLLPFEIVGVLLLVAMVGVILLSKREVK
jgi:NADH-quinone oxidoreductase subunit J